MRGPFLDQYGDVGVALFVSPHENYWGGGARRCDPAVTAMVLEGLVAERLEEQAGATLV